MYLKKILLLIPQNIIPVTDGGKQGLYYPMKILGEYFDVKVVVFVGSHERYEYEEYKKINVEPVFLPTDKRDNLLNICINIFKKLPFKFDRYFSKDNIIKVVDLCNNWKPDIVICHHAHLAAYGKIIGMQFPKIQLILREHNIEYIIVQQFAEVNKNIFKKAIAYWQYIKAKKIEEQSWTWFNKVLFISDSDIEIAKRKIERNNFYLLPDGATLVSLLSVKKKPAFLFAGALITLQNIYNLSYFIHQIWIPWKNEFSNEEYELWISGNTLEVVIDKVNIKSEDLSKFKIKVLGFVDDIVTIIQSAKFFLSPTIIGAGIRMKVLEAMCNGSVVFLTDIDEKMLSVLNDNENVVVYNSVSEFNFKFNQFISDDELYNKVSVAAYQLAQKRLTWDVFNVEYLRIINK